MPWLPKKPLAGQGLQVASSLTWDDHERECGRVRRDHQIVRQPGLEAQSRHSEGAVLIDLVHVHGVVARLRDAPGYAALVPVFHVAGHGGPAGLVEQGVLIAGQEQQRHEVLEHRAAPGHQAQVAAAAGEQAAQREPVFLRHLVFSDQQVAGQAGFGGQQVVPRRVAAALAYVVADAQQLPLRVVHQVEVHGSQVVTAGYQRIDVLEPPLGGHLPPGWASW